MSLARLRCAVGDKGDSNSDATLSFAKVDDARLDRYLRVLGPRNTLRAMMKLDALHCHRRGIALWIDADMCSFAGYKPKMCACVDITCADVV